MKILYILFYTGFFVWCAIFPHDIGKLQMERHAQVGQTVIKDFKGSKYKR